MHFEMLSLSFIVPLTILSLIALVINVTILLIVILCKQVTPSNILLFHLGIIESLLCIVFLIFSVPLLTRGDENTITTGICNVNAFFFTLLHSIALWTVCGLNFDRYYCISAPLHYNAIVSTNKVVCGLVCGWFVAILFTIPPLFGVAPYRLYKDIGFCGPHFTDANSLWYAITFTLCTFIIPGSLIILCNVKVFMIARYHRHRIAAAIFEVTLSAQVTITHQRNPFPLPFEAIPPKLRARSPVTSVFQIVGSLLLLYSPYYVTIVWNSSVASLSNSNLNATSKNMQVPCIIMLIAFILIHLTVFINIIIYGLKSKVIRNSFKNYWRKKKTKNEMNNEIQARTPSTCGSRRPSINTAMNLSRSVSHRRLSETYVNLNQLTNGNRPQIKRIASELSWQPNHLPDALLPHASSDTLRIPHNESVESFDVDSAGCSGSGGGGGGNIANMCESNEIRLKMMRSFRDKPLTMKSLSTTSLQPINMTSGRGGVASSNTRSKLPVTYFHTTCKEVRRYLQISTKKMFRIDLNDSHKRNEPLSPLRSPQILITADSDDSDPMVHSSPISVQQKLDSSTSFMETEFDWKTHPINDDDKSDDSDNDDNLPFDRCAMQIKRSRSLDEQDVSKCSNSSYGAGGGGDCDEPHEPLLLSWPPVRKLYKSVPNVSPFGDDQCDRPKIVL